MYIGGFARMGGIESFVRDLLLAVAPTCPQRELVIWGRAGRDHRLLQEIAESGARVVRSPWRWGCAWRWPDYFLAPAGLGAVQRAAVVIFKRLPPPRILGWLRKAAVRNGKRVPFVMIMPYRPAEYWGSSPSPERFEHLDAIVVPSDDGVEDLRRAGFRGVLEKIPLLPPKAAPLAEFPSSSYASKLRLGFLGRLVEQKNLPYLLQAYRALTEVLDREHAYELHLFGDGDQRGDLERTSREMALQDVFFHGETPRAETARAIDSCDLFLNASTTEGQCIAALEILARGRPLVATPVGALPEVLADPDLGRVAPLGDPKSFASVVSAVAQAVREKKMTPSSVATAFHRRYDHDAIAERYLDLFRRLALND
jgi:glycosyltransferase involved in cell wall biosynthesis